MPEFLFGSQYYRAPTPDPECWEEDLHRMRHLGFNSVKYWVQWRWSHRLNDRFEFGDLDRLMYLAGQNNLQVTLNTIFDVAPHWLYEKYPDARQVMNNGHVVEPYVVGHRQIGGHPGPCYNHPGTRFERQLFMTRTLEHFRSHPALAMWDVWNEPELSFPQRKPDIDMLVCYCPHCCTGFLTWLQQKYGSLHTLNQVWGRCYETWQQVEMPRSAQTFTDFIDWREFHIATMTAEANWRLDLTSRLDPVHTRYLHVVPNMMSVWSSVSCCSDDFELAKNCQVFAATMNGGSVLAPQVLSAARGKLCYNVESHINFGATPMHQRVLTLHDLLADWLPQIGLGIRGFLFWQYRAETLGMEAPAWGLVRPDGFDRPITKAVREFWQKFQPHASTILACPPHQPQIGILKSRKNEIFHFAMHQELGPLVDSVEGYVDCLYQHNYAYRFISGEMLAAGDLDDLRLLILPSCYYLTEEEMKALDQFVRAGGAIIAESHLGGYNGTSGRHSRQVPGGSLWQSWGIREIETTSSYHLHLEQSEAYQGAATEDVRKALGGQETSEGMYFPIQHQDGDVIWGASRYAALAGEDIQPLGFFEPGVPCLLEKSVGQGKVIYCGTNLGQAAKKDPQAFARFVLKILRSVGLFPILDLKADPVGWLRLDVISDEAQPFYLTIVNRSAQTVQCTLDRALTGKGLFSQLAFSAGPDHPITIPANFADLILLDQVQP
jgi:beta-galactosidase